MSERTSPHQNLTDYFADRRKWKRPTFLDDIEKVIDWRPLEKLLRRKLRRSKDAVGNPAYSPLLMYKILLLQRWYTLSDEALALYDWISFARFAGLPLEGEVPDATTICRFRSSLAERNLLTKLLGLLNKQFEAKGVLVRKDAIVDATVVASARRPVKTIDIMAKDREEGEGDPGVKAVISYSDDIEAAWLRKGKKCYYDTATRSTRPPSPGPLHPGRPCDPDQPL